MSDTESPVWVIPNAAVTLNDGRTIPLGQVNVYASGLLVNPQTRTTISPSAYVSVAPAARRE